MADDPKRRAQAPRPGKTDDGVGALAARALSVVAGRSVEARRSDPDPRLLDLLDAAARDASRSAIREAVETLQDAGVRNEEIADLYIPRLARRMGDRWCQDQMSFAEVTIGVSRLQSLLRDLGPEWRADAEAAPDAPAALVVVAMDDYHTLGAMILAGQLRRAGLSVRLKLGARPEDLARDLEEIAVDAVMVSASVGESLETLRRLVKAAKDVNSRTPVVIGGTVLWDHEDLPRLTGADWATSDVSEALERCGLTISREGAKPSGPTG